jgi:DnaJ-domain-containing protein 1
MPPRSSLRYWLGRFLTGVLLLVLAGFVLPRLLRAPSLVVTFPVGFAGFYLALSAITPLVRFASLAARTRAAWSEAASEAFARASLPRRIYYLLASVAEIDGPMSAAERETVRQFVLERFDPVLADELRLWEEQPLHVTDRVGLAARVARGLDETELDSLFCWCCLVALADGKYREHHHAVLQEIARGLGIAPARARLLFHLAKEQHLRGERQEPARGDASAVDERQRALATLGLPRHADAEAIRKRHRELVRRFHPDAQPSLGPIAQREATERFREIQRAYEVLTSAAT